MQDTKKFIETISAGYAPKGDYIVIGGGMLGGVVTPEAIVKAPLATINRHGLIAGATGTGKTKSIQKFAEALSQKGCPVFIMDIKGDISGLSQPGTTNSKIEERAKHLGISWEAKNLPVEFLTITQSSGARIRSTVSEFGPVLFSKMLELNDTQSGVIAIIFKYCDDQNIPLLDLDDVKKTLQYATNEGKSEISEKYGSVSESTVGTIMRKLIELESQDGAGLFGERSFDVSDLVRKDSNGNGYINIMRLSDMQTKPKLFSTMMLALLAEIYETFPEEGDVEKPKLTLFIDEAHLIFDEASKALLDQIETIIKLIRSKGVGVYFITQNPIDIPASVLSQLGLKIQHALRAFTANDRKAIKQASENYPITDFYDIDETITTLGIGEAFVTLLDEKGNPTPLVHTMMCPPETRMDTISDSELNAVVANSQIAQKYNEVINRESAFEILSEKISRIQETALQESKMQTNTSTSRPSGASARKEKPEPGMIENISKNTMVRQVGRAVVTEVTRGILGIFGLGGRRR
jgi:uncharacterized protein